MGIQDVIIRLEKLIAIYFNGDNYVFDGVELSRIESKMVMRSLMHSLELAEMLLNNKSKF